MRLSRALCIILLSPTSIGSCAATFINTRTTRNSSAIARKIPNFLLTEEKVSSASGYAGRHQSLDSSQSISVNYSNARTRQWKPSAETTSTKSNQTKSNHQQAIPNLGANRPSYAPSNAPTILAMPTYDGVNGVSNKSSAMQKNMDTRGIPTEMPSSIDKSPNWSSSKAPTTTISLTAKPKILMNNSSLISSKAPTAAPTISIKAISTISSSTDRNHQQATRSLGSNSPTYTPVDVPSHTATDLHKAHPAAQAGLEPSYYPNGVSKISVVTPTNTPNWSSQPSTQSLASKSPSYTPSDVPIEQDSICPSSTSCNRQRARQSLGSSSPTYTPVNNMQ